MPSTNVQEALARFYRKRGFGVLASTANSKTAAANTAVVLTRLKQTNKASVIGLIGCSYSSVPTNGALTVEDGSGNVVWQQDILTGGNIVLPFDPPLRGSDHTDLIVTLSAGGGTVVGKLNLHAWFED